VHAEADLRPLLRGVSHAVAFWIALAASVVLIALAHGATGHAAAVVYGAALCALFGVSATYHRWRRDPRWRPLLRRLDHSTIFVFIAASYTPVALLVLEGTLSRVILVVVWAGALAGVAMSLWWIDAPRWLAAGIYLALGWVVIAAVPQMLQRMSTAPLVLLAAGGLLYTTGAIIYALRRPDPWPRTFGFHEVFHALVIAAATVHFVAMAGWVIGSSS